MNKFINLIYINNNLKILINYLDIGGAIFMVESSIIFDSFNTSFKNNKAISINGNICSKF